ncbi:MAG: 4a-hydroxytetrahydrobiopterin dehydratase [Glaciecola sp.]|jgi:4a-hydroxytetrahydrobiopterin dehydratase
MEPLTAQELSDVLAALPAWDGTSSGLHREYRFANFREAVSFIVRLGFEAEQRGHHPELTNVYNRVGVTFRTHDAGNLVTAMDVEMARAADGAAGLD